MLPDHLKGLNLSPSGVITVEGRTINVWEFSSPTDPAHLDSWALHFRRQYCSDLELPELLMGTGMTTEEYLNAYIFPDKTRAPGPSIRSGDFAEFLISDYLEFTLNLWVPRENTPTRQATMNLSKVLISLASINWILPTPFVQIHCMLSKLKPLFRETPMAASSRVLLTTDLTISI